MTRNWLAVLVVLVGVAVMKATYRPHIAAFSMQNLKCYRLRETVFQQNANRKILLTTGPAKSASTLKSGTAYFGKKTSI
jgi:hypothetical protein